MLANVAEVRFSDLAGFTPFQERATRTADEHLFTLVGGTRGPGKSYWLRWWLLRLVLLLKDQGISSPAVGLFCEDYPVLRDRQIKKIKAEFPRELGVVKSTQEEGLGFHLHNGGMIALRNLDDPSKYVGAEFAAIGVDEITKNPQDIFDILRGSLRWPGVDWCPFAVTGNPGGIGHLWVKQLWIDRELWPELESEYSGDDFAYVRGVPDDNPYLSESYWRMLRSIKNEELRRAWLEGDWDVFVGQVFTEWRRHLHVIKPMPLPGAYRWCAVDWGYSVPWCALWFARCKLDHPDYDPDLWRTVVYREAYEAGLTDPEQAERICDLEAEDEDVRDYLADPSMWTKHTTGKREISTADVYRENGIRLRPAERDRITGKRRVHEALSLLPDERPGLLVFENCRNLIRTLPALPYDETRVEDVDTDAEDHAYDTLRYGLSYKVPKRRGAVRKGGDVWAPARRGVQQAELERLTQYPWKGDDG